MALLKWFILMVTFTNRILSLKQVAGAKLTLHILTLVVKRSLHKGVENMLFFFLEARKTRADSVREISRDSSVEGWHSIDYLFIYAEFELCLIFSLVL